MQQLARLTLVALVFVSIFATPALPSAERRSAAGGLSTEELASIDGIVQTRIARDGVPARVRMANDDTGRVPMSTDTVFDLASLTKVVASTTAVILLVEQRRIDSDVILLTNRTYPHGRGDAQPLRDAILKLVAMALR